MRKALLLVLFFCLATTAPALTIDKKDLVSLAVIPGLDKSRPSELVIANLEVGLSDLKGVALVERSLINKVLQELTLGEAGFQDKKLAVNIGQLVEANILLFAEKISQDATVTPSDQKIIRLRMVESQTGIVLGTLLETEDRLHAGLKTVYSGGARGRSQHKNRTG